jgi:oxygen-dependent protoporphyrinogen oxidase
MHNTPDIVIVGGGIAGLSAAFELHKRGIPFRLLERADRFGGVILTEQIDGFTIDAGPDSLLVQKPAAIALCRELGLGDRLMFTKTPRQAFVRRAGMLHPLPEGSVLGIPTRWRAFLTSRLFSITGKIRMAAEVAIPPRRTTEDESVASFIRRRFGKEAVEYLAEPLLAGIHAGDVDRLSMRALFPRFVEAERQHGSVIRAFRRTRMPASTEGAFVSLPGGIGELASALVLALPADALRVNASVKSIEGPSPFVVTLASGESFSAPAVILGTPAFVTADLVRPVDTALSDLCAAVPYASSAAVALAYPRSAVAHPLRGSGFLVPRVERMPITAATWVSSKWPRRAPDDHVLLRAYLGGARDPRAIESSDAELTEQAHRILGEVLGISGKPRLARVYRWTKANAQHEVGHLDRVAAIDRRLRESPGLYLTGSGFRGVGIADCIADARATAATAAQQLTRR